MTHVLEIFRAKRQSMVGFVDAFPCDFFLLSAVNVK